MDLFFLGPTTQTILDIDLKGLCLLTNAWGVPATPARGAVVTARPVAKETHARPPRTARWSLRGRCGLSELEAFGCGGRASRPRLRGRSCPESDLLHRMLARRAEICRGAL